MDEKSDGAKLYRAKLDALGLSQEAAARRLMISLSTSQRYANGVSRVPPATLELLDRWLAETKTARKPRKKRA